MATKLFLRNTQYNRLGLGCYDMVTTAGSAEDTAIVTTTASGTEIQWTKTAGGQAIKWVSGRVPSGGFTLTTTDISIWAWESTMLINVGGRFKLFKLSGGISAELAGGPFDDGIEFTATATPGNEMTWTGDNTDTAFLENDRLILIVYATNIGTMAAGTATILFNGADASNGDSFLNLNETVAFKPEPAYGNAFNSSLIRAYHHEELKDYEYALRRHTLGRSRAFRRNHVGC